MYLALFLSLICGVSGANKEYYDSFYGTRLPPDQVKKHEDRNTTFWCVLQVEDCNPYEGRRLDGTCNNLRHPTRGAAHTPYYRMLPAAYHKNFEPRKAKDGSDLPLSRYLRTSLLSEGRIPDQKFTMLVAHYLVFLTADIAAQHDTVNYVLRKPYCCTSRGKTDPECTPNKVPDDDPVHRFSNIRCLNMTRPISFQTYGCVPNNTIPERINSATPLFDLSIIYGNIPNMSLSKGRLFVGGMLKYEIENDREWPPSANPEANVCLLNQKPAEKRCHDTPDDSTNTILGLNLVSIWFWRQHNRVASELSRLNPCWNDETLFYTARDINISILLQIFYYELLPLLLGRENLIRDNVISEIQGFRDFYNEHVIPQMSLEYPLAMRWIHTVQEGNMKMYDLEGHYLKQFPIVNLTLRTGYLAVDDNIDYITQGSFRQASGKFDHTVDPDIAEVILGPHQRASDVLTNDIAKNRYFGFPPYIKYRELCSGHHYKTFHDLADVIAPEYLERLKDVYKHVEDIDLMAGLWVEKHIHGGFVPPTFYCIVVDQLIRNMVSDRHWYERPNRPNAFNFEQLIEIRKASMSRLLCDVGDKVSFIQPHAFLRAGLGNEICSCSSIPKINLKAWRDPTCGTSYYDKKHK